LLYDDNLLTVSADTQLYELQNNATPSPTMRNFRYWGKFRKENFRVREFPLQTIASSRIFLVWKSQNTEVYSSK